MIQKILEKLISFKTISGNHLENKKALEGIKNQIKHLPVYITEFESNGFSSLVITTQKNKQPIIWLQAHLDVVSGATQAFCPQVVNKRLYGRGAIDMKFAIACYIKLLKDLDKNLPKYNFGIMITTDEEIGGFNGVKFLLDKGFSSKVCFLPDGGKNWQFIKTSKGIWDLSIQSKGKSSHAARPWLGQNALNELIDFLNELRKKFPQEPCHIKDHYHETFNIGKITGGNVANQVPDFAEALVDIRFTPKMNKVKLQKIIDLSIKNFRNIKIKEIFFYDSFAINPENYYVQLFSQIAYEKLKIKTTFINTPGSSDACFFIQKNIPVVMIRPNGGNFHADNE